ncbi:MAG: site-specific DNA-methyltransferase [Burkholderiales bacterium]
MKIEQLPTADLIPYARNTRTHSPEQVAQIAGSIREFGFTNPVLIDGENGIIAGHGRVMAASKLGLAKVPCIRLAHLTETQKRAYIIADNKLALNAGWDEEMLALEIGELQETDFDIDLLGFDQSEIDALFPIEVTEGLTDEDDVPEVPEQPVTVQGDVWVLGRHRLMCGDSTSIDAVERLMAGRKADMVFTDPPYGVSYTGGLSDKGQGLKSNARQMIANDDVDLYEDAVKIAAIVCNGPVFMFYADTVPFGLYRGIEAVGGEVVALLIWKKRGGYGAMGASYKPNHEPCVIWKKKGARLNFVGATTENRVWEEKKDGTNKLHPTQKPVSIAERAIGNHKAEIVLDLFGGSGSTLIACEKTARDCRMMELDPKYCDVIIKRWQDFTGQQATHESSGKTYAEMLATQRGES